MNSIAKPKPLVLKESKIIIIVLRLIVFTSIYIILFNNFELKKLPLLIWIMLGLFLLSEIIYLIEHKTNYLIQRLLGWIFILDALLISIIIYYMPSNSTEIFISYFSVIAIAAMARNVKTSFIITILISLLSIYMTSQKGDLSLNDYLTKPLFLFSVAIFSGYLSEETSRQFKKRISTEQNMDLLKQEHIVSESKLSLVEQELDLVKKNFVAQERIRALGQMASGIAHDFNNILAPVLGFSELLIKKTKAGTLDKEQELKYLNNIFKAANTAAELIRKLRSFYRKKESAHKLIKVDINKLVLAAIEMSRPKWKEESQGKGINIEVMTHLEKCPFILCNEAELNDALINLIFNAVEAMTNNGTITFKTFYNTDYDLVMLTISDTGNGMSEEQIQQSIEPFFSTKTGGSGLGLSMAYGIFQKHGCNFNITSSPGKGTTIHVSFPPTKNNPDFEQAKQQTVKKVPSLNILLVDDMPLPLETVKEFLLAAGHTVTTAVNGEDALSKFSPEKFQLVITDKSMPKMNGIKLAENIKKISPNTPIILLTGFSDELSAAKESQEIFNIIIGKPIKYQELMDAISKAFSPS